MKHLLEPDDKFDNANVDLEGAHTAPIVQDGSNVLDANTGGGERIAPSTPVNDGRDEESILADEAAAAAFDDITANQPENDVADLFMDDMDVGDPAEESRMVDALIIAGLTREIAKEVTKSFQTNIPPATFMEVYGRSVRDYSLLTRRIFNVVGLDALDLRTVTHSGEPWDFRKRTDIHEARRLLRERKPTWVIGAPPMYCI